MLRLETSSSGVNVSVVLLSNTVCMYVGCKLNVIVIVYMIEEEGGELYLLAT